VSGRCQFTAWWQQASGAAYHPWADVVTMIGFLDDLRDDWGSGIGISVMLPRLRAASDG
jgi:hypothetical protein